MLSTQLQTQFSAEGLQYVLSFEDGIPTVTVYRPSEVMTFDRAVRIAAQLQYDLAHPVHFQRMDAESVSFFVFTAARDWGSMPADYGVPVAQWIVTASQLPALYSFPEAILLDDGADKPTEAQGFGFCWTRRSDFYSDARSGKWCVMRDASTIDALWVSVHDAVMAGLFPAALVSTPKQAETFGGSYLICLFNTDWTDAAQVKATRDFLRSVGVTEDIGYKRDIDTSKDVYGTPDEWLHRE